MKQRYSSLLAVSCNFYFIFIGDRQVVVIFVCCFLVFTFQLLCNLLKLFQVLPTFK